MNLTSGLKDLQSGDPAARLVALALLERRVERERERAVVALMLDQDGAATWATVGRALGVTRQAARQRYAQLVEQELRRRIRKGYAAA